MARGLTQAEFDAAVKEACRCFETYYELGRTEEERILKHYEIFINEQLLNPELVIKAKEAYEIDDRICQYEPYFDWKHIEAEFKIMVKLSKHREFTWKLLSNIAKHLHDKGIPVSLWPFALRKWVSDKLGDNLEPPPGNSGKPSEYYRNKVFVTIIRQLVKMHDMTPTRNTLSKKFSAADAVVKAYLIIVNGYPEKKEYEDESRKKYEAYYDKLYSSTTKAWTNRDKLVSPFSEIQHRSIVEASVSRNIPLSEYP